MWQEAIFFFFFAISNLAHVTFLLAETAYGGNQPRLLKSIYIGTVYTLCLGLAYGLFSTLSKIGKKKYLEVKTSIKKKKKKKVSLNYKILDKKFCGCQLAIINPQLL